MRRKQGAGRPFDWCVEPLERRLLLASQAYIWQNLNIGGGGFVTGIFYDPHNANVIYARTDVGGLFKSVNDGTNWSQLLNFVGNNATGSGNGTQFQEFGVLSFAMDPENSNNLYADVGEYQGTNGDVLYSTNAGATWNTTPLTFWVGGNSNGRAAGERIAVDPYDSNIVLLGSNDSGLWESTNAGHSFTQLTSLSTSASINFVYFDPYGGTAATPTKEIFVGENSTASGTNLYESNNGGTSFTEVTGSGSPPTGWMPNRTALASDGNLYVAYSNALTPDNFASNGGILRYNTATGVWANISPVVPQVTNGMYDQFGYVGIALDPNSSTTLVVTSFDRYNFDDEIWRTTNANASSPSWTTLYEDFHYQSYNPTRNTTNAPWAASNSDGINNWASDVAIDPFNSAQMMYTSGGGIFATNNGTSTTTLTAPDSWYFPDTGIEMTAELSFAATTGGTPLYSGLGDLGGFAHTTLAFSPQQGNYGGGNGDSVDYAGLAPNDAAVVGIMGTTYGLYTTNGTTFTAFAANPGGSNAYSGGTVAISANGATIVWAPSGQNAYYSTNNGSSWAQSTLGASGALPTGGTIVSDKVNPNYVYYWTENSSDNSWTLYVSSDGGHTFNAAPIGSQATGNPTVVVNPYVAGQLWLSTYVGIYEITNFGANVSHPSSYSINTNTGSFAVGAPAPSSTYPALYMYGTLTSGGFEGIYRSDDGGNSWLLLNDANHQWGGTGVIAADPNVFGRIYTSEHIGNPATNLPAGWSDSDINEPGNPGWATSSTTLSSGTTVNQWNLAGGAAGFSSTPITVSSLSRTGGVATAVTTTASGLQVGQTIDISGAANSAYDGTFVVTGLFNTTAGLSNHIGAATEFTFAIAAGTDTASGTITATLDDQFNFAYQPITGSAAISAQVHSITNADEGNGTPQGGVMYRASTNPDDPFFAVVQTSAGSLLLEYRATTGGGITSTSLGGLAVGAEYVKIIRIGNNFGGYYSSNGTSWTQLGSTIAIAAMPATANAGFMATASYNPQLTDATFTNVTVDTGPTVSMAAGANPNPVTGTSTGLTASGSENGSGAGLTYTWSATGPATVHYAGGANGTNGAQSITANFTKAGSYPFTVTITDSNGLTVTSPITVTVIPVLSSLAFGPLPGSAAAGVGLASNLTVSSLDQFNNVITNDTSTITLSIATGSGSLMGTTTVQAQNGVATFNSLAISAPGNFTVQASNGAGLTATSGGFAVADPTGLSRGSGAQYAVTGFPGTETLDVIAGTITLTGNLSTVFSNESIQIENGAMVVLAASQTAGQLQLVGTGTLDIGVNALTLDFGAGTDPVSTVVSEIVSGRNGGNWLGAGITSSAAASGPAGKFAIAYLDATDAGGVAGQLALKYDIAGDANFDGSVSIADFAILQNNFNQTGKDWSQGDFNYDTTVSVADFAILQNNFGHTVAGAGGGLPALASPANVAAAAIPEPSLAGDTSAKKLDPPSPTDQVISQTSVL